MARRIALNGMLALAALSLGGCGSQGTVVAGPRTATPSASELMKLEGTHYRGVELSSSSAPVHLKSIRWWSGR